MRKFISFLILTFCMLALLSVVASAVTLTAGQFENAGSVTVTVIDDGGELRLCVTYDTVDGWRLVETHFAIAASPEDFPQTKKGNPKVGHFPYGDDELLGEYDVDGNLIGGEESYNECILLSELGEDGVEVGDIVYIAAQASLLNLDNIIDYVPETDPAVPIYQQETGWGDGTEFADDRNWAMYFVVLEIPEPEPEP
jgi:hypothetical protein